MNIDFNNVRRQACAVYDELARKLNANIAGGRLQMDADEIRGEMDVLRGCIATIACCYEPGDNDFRDVYNEIYDDETTMVAYNPEDVT